MHYHGLDHPSNRRQCETQWQEFLHRNHAPLLWFQRPRCRIVFPVRFRIWRYALAREPMTARLTGFSRDVRVRYHHR